MKGLSKKISWFRRPFTWVILVLLLGWGGLMVSRDTLRAHLWAYQLTHTNSAGLRMIYFQKLSSLRDRATPAAASLLTSSDPGLRSLAVGILHHASGPKALTQLIIAVTDEDLDVSRLAMQGLALREKGGIDALETIIHGEYERRAMMAVASLVVAPIELSGELLLSLLLEHPHTGVRIEAIRVVADSKIEAAVPLLIELLRDESVYMGDTEQDRLATQAFEGAGRQVMNLMGSPQEVALVQPGHHYLWREASKALTAITGFDPWQGSSDLLEHLEVSIIWRQWQDR